MKGQSTTIALNTIYIYSFIVSPMYSIVKSSATCIKLFRMLYIFYFTLYFFNDRTNL